MAKENAAEPEVKKSRHRSPNYPAIGLIEAIDRAGRFYRTDQKTGAPLETALRHMGFSGKHGKSMMVLSALKKFGLVEDIEGRIVPTQRAIEIVALKEGDPRRQKAIKEAVLSPDIYRELWEQYAETGIPPQDDTLASELVAYKGFNQAAVADFVKDFRESLDFSGISNIDAVQSGVGKTREEEKGNPPKIGDFVQWQSLGVLQFAEPKRIRATSEDGLWAFVDGSETGLPVKELTVEKQASVDIIPPEITKPPAAQPPKMALPPPSVPVHLFSWPLSKDVVAEVKLTGMEITAAHLELLRSYLDLAKQAMGGATASSPIKP